MCQPDYMVNVGLKIQINSNPKYQDIIQKAIAGTNVNHQ